MFLKMKMGGLLNGEDLIIKQNSVLKELPSKGLKDFCPNNSWIEKKQIESKLEEKFNFINTERIEKSNNLSLAEWVPKLGKAKVLKKIGKIWETIGHHQDNEDWLLPEEILFLVENCELQLILDNICASVEDCYTLLLQEECCSLDDYRVYSYLSRAGLRVVRHAPSVTVTPYEKQVNLDAVLQKSRRSPPPCTSEAKFVDNEEDEVTIIDEDISVLSKSEKKNKRGLYKGKDNFDLIEVIEIEDEVNSLPIIQEVIDSSDDSSDIICISSPSYTSTEQYRLWYPTVQKSLLRSVEKIIDLSDDDSPKDLFRNKLDLIKASKTEVLSLLPSLTDQDPFIHSPDNRLLPDNVVPQYTEYAVSVNIRSNNFAQNRFNQHHPPSPSHPLTNMMNNRQINPTLNNALINPMVHNTQMNSMMHNARMDPELINNPLFRKAEEMHTMAMNMIQTATTLMSALSSQNPNELWNLVESRNQDFIQYHPRFNALQQRPYYPRSFHRRNFRNIRRRHPYEKRYGGRPFRRPYQYNRDTSISDLPVKINPSSEVKMEVVVLSDDEEIINRNRAVYGDGNGCKRKNIDSGMTCKKLKTEDDPINLSVAIEEPPSILDKKPNKTSEINGNKENIKDKCSNSLFDSNSVELVNAGKSETDCRDNFSKTVSTVKINAKTNLDNEKVDHESIRYNEQNNKLNCNENIVRLDESVNTLENEQQTQESSNKTKEKVENHDATDVDSGNIVNKDNILSSNNVQSNEENMNDTVMRSKSGNAHDGEITCWEEYKNNEESHLNDEEECIEETESLIKLEENITYGDILTAFQIFKVENVTNSKKKFKISYDVYLPETTFKKSLKVLPNFRVIVSKPDEELPTPMDLKCLETEYQDHIPFLFSVVFNETVGFYLYETVSLPTFFE